MNETDWSNLVWQLYYINVAVQNCAGYLANLPAVTNALSVIAGDTLNNIGYYISGLTSELDATRKGPLENIDSNTYLIAYALQHDIPSSVGTIAPALDRLTAALPKVEQSDFSNLSDNVWLGARAVDDLNSMLTGFLQAYASWMGMQGAGGQEQQVSFVNWLTDKGADSVGGSLVGMLNSVVSGIVSFVAGMVKWGIDTAHAPIEAAFTNIINDNLQTVTNAISSDRSLQPDDSIRLATTALGKAILFGAEAHGIAAAAELIHPTKELGFPMLAASLAEQAAFGPIIREYLGRRFSLSIGRTSEWQARWLYRTVWADLRATDQMFMQGRISADSLRDRLRFEGWRDYEIDAYVGSSGNERYAVPYHKARPFDLATIYDDVTAPDAWILDQLTRSGYHPDDAAEIMVGLRHRSMRTHINSYITELTGTYSDGLLSEQQLRDYLSTLGLRSESADYIVRKGSLALWRQQTKRLWDTYTDLCDKGLITIDAFTASGKALGVSDGEIAVETARITARQQGEVVQAEHKATEAAVRKQQALLATLWSDKVKRGLATPDDYLAALIQAGYKSEQATAMAQIVAVEQIPVLQLPTAKTPAAEAQQVQGIMAQEILDRLKEKQVSPDVATAYLVSLGIPNAEAAARVALAVTQSWRPAPVTPPPKEPAAVRTARTNRTNALVTDYQGGLLTEAQLQAALVQIGDPSDVAASIVQEEQAKREVRLTQQTKTQQQQTMEEIKGLERDTTLALLKQGSIGATAAVAALLTYGYTKAEATLLVQRQQARTPAQK